MHDKVRANLDRIPTGVPEPLIVGRGIDDVAIVVLTLAPKPEVAYRWRADALTDVARELRVELSKLEDVGLTYLAGDQSTEFRVEPDPEALARYGVTLQQLAAKVQGANTAFRAGLVRDSALQVEVVAGRTLQTLPEIGNLLLTTRDNRPVYVRDVAKVVVDSEPNETRAAHFSRDADGAFSETPTVSIAIAKRAGANAVVISERIVEQLEQLKGRVVPEDITVQVTRNYGETANEKANELLFHLGLATLSIVLLVAVSIGWREALVVAIVIPTTILLTLFASRIMGYTLNRVSLFALIFSIGILVDDAIVVIENIARHWAMHDGRSRIDAAIDGVAEVGNPTIVATLTVVAALLPMLFVSGLMGPYMSPIPANASAAMVFSFFVAVILTPWLMMKSPAARRPSRRRGHSGGVLGVLYRRAAAPILRTRRSARRFLIGVGIATLASLSLFYFKAVTVKLLPFDNKAEVAIIADLPRRTSVEATNRVLMEAVARVKDVPEILSLESYAGTAAPFNFNGLVRHYYMRNTPETGDIQVNLKPRGQRSRSSHEIALDIRQKLAGIDAPPHTSIKVVEPPPGPPVLATLLAEIYGPDPQTRRAVAAKVRQAFESGPLHRRYRQFLWRAAAAQAHRHRSGLARIFWRAAGRRVRHFAAALWRPGGRLFASRRRPPAFADPHGARQGPAPGRRDYADHASSRQHPARQPHDCRTRRRGANTGRACLLPDLPPQWPRGGNGAGGTGGRLRGAALRLAGGGRRARQDGVVCGHSQAANPAARTTARRKQALAVVGRRVGGHLGDFQRHGRRLHGRSGRHLYSGGGAVQKLQTAAGDPDADSADFHRHHVRALDVPCRLSPRLR